MPHTMEPRLPVSTEQMSRMALVLVLSKYYFGGVVRARE